MPTLSESECKTEPNQLPLIHIVALGQLFSLPHGQYQYQKLYKANTNTYIGTNKLYLNIYV